MKKKKKINLKLNNLYLYWAYMHYFRKYGILLLTQNLSLDAKNDLYMQLALLDNGAEYKVVLIDKFSNIKQNNSFNYNIWQKIKNFNCFVGIKNIEDIFKIEKILKEYKVLIKGYYIQNIFFSKHDWNIKKIEKKTILENFKQRLNFFFLILVKIIIILKKRV